MATTYDFRGDTLRSKFELNFAKHLYNKNIKYKYEPYSLEYYIKTRLATCRECGSHECWELHHYTPDFLLPDYNILIETKGKFTPKMRSKMIGVKINNKNKDLRLVFMRDNKLNKTSSIRYSDWARKFGFLYHIGEGIPEKWVVTKKDIEQLYQE